jgi:hypothetical protein
MLRSREFLVIAAICAFMAAGAAVIVPSSFGLVGTWGDGTSARNVIETARGMLRQ